MTFRGRLLFAPNLSHCFFAQCQVVTTKFWLSRRDFLGSIDAIGKSAHPRCEASGWSRGWRLLTPVDLTAFRVVLGRSRTCAEVDFSLIRRMVRQGSKVKGPFQLGRAHRLIILCSGQRDRATLSKTIDIVGCAPDLPQPGIH